MLQSLLVPLQKRFHGFCRILFLSCAASCRMIALDVFIDIYAAMNGLLNVRQNTLRTQIACIL